METAAGDSRRIDWCLPVGFGLILRSVFLAGSYFELYFYPNAVVSPPRY